MYCVEKLPIDARGLYRLPPERGSSLITRQEQITALRSLLSAVVPKGKLSSTEIDALIVYIAEVTKTEDEAIQRLSGILQSDLNGITTWKTVLQVELMSEKIAAHQGRVQALEQKDKPDMGKWPMVQAIFTAM